MKCYMSRMDLHLSALIFMLCLLSDPLHSASYYVDATQGLDTNSGRSAAESWKTVAKATDFALQPGDSVLFRRGEIWREKFYITSSGTQGNPLYFGAYGDGEKPKISAVDEIPGWTIRENWAYFGQNIWIMQGSMDPQRLLIDGEEVLRSYPVSNIDGVESKWTYSNDSLYVYAEGNPAQQFQSMTGSQLYYTLRIRNQQWVTLENLDMEGGSGNCIALFACRYVDFRHCSIGRYAWLGIRLNAEAGQPSEYITIEENDIDSGFHFYYGPPEKRGVEDGILLAGGAQNCIIRNNRVLDWAHCGVYCYALDATDPGVYNNIICNNYISGENISYMHGIGTDGQEGLCRDNYFYNNLIQHTTVRNQINGNNNRVSYNIIDGMTNSPVKSGGTAQGFMLQCYGAENGLVCHDNRIENNTIMNCDEAGVRLEYNGGDKINNYFRNNIIYNCGLNSKDGQDSCGIVIDDHVSVRGNCFDNNCIFGENAEKVIFYRGDRLSLSEFNRRDGENGDEIRNNIQEDPLFMTGSGDPWRPDSTSPCIDAGLMLGYDSDFYGNPVPAGLSADMGACELQAATTDLLQEPLMGEDFELDQNYPNPFNSFTTLTVHISHLIPTRISVKIFTIRGECLLSLSKSVPREGDVAIRFDSLLPDGSLLPSGEYLYRFEYGNTVKTGKMCLLK